MELKPEGADGRVEAPVGLLERIADASFQEVILGGTTRERKLTYLLRDAAAEIEKLRYALDHYAHGGSECGRIAREALGMTPNTQLQPASCRSDSDGK